MKTKHFASEHCRNYVEVREYLLTPLDTIKPAEILHGPWSDIRAPLTEISNDISSAGLIELDTFAFRTLTYRVMIKAYTHVLKPCQTKTPGV